MPIHIIAGRSARPAVAIYRLLDQPQQRRPAYASFRILPAPRVRLRPLSRRTSLCSPTILRRSHRAASRPPPPTRFNGQPATGSRHTTLVIEVKSASFVRASRIEATVAQIDAYRTAGSFDVAALAFPGGFGKVIEPSSKLPRSRSGISTTSPQPSLIKSSSCLPPRSLGCFLKPIWLNPDRKPTP